MDIPLSDNIVRVKLLDTTTYLTGKAFVFVDPVVPGHETFSFYDLAFFIENEAQGKKVMFDLGTRKDYWNLAPAVQRVFGADTVMDGIRVEKDVSEILEDGGVALESINSCIWSHYHYDHCGNMSPFPSSTSITVGSGFKAAGLLPGYPEDPKSPVLASDFANRDLIEVNFEHSFSIGGFPAYDYFGDGSFYLLDSPGHCPGHLCALARTTPSSAEGGATFVFMGGDICHFAGDFRPSPEKPLPDPIPESIIKWRNEARNFPACPCSLTAHHPNTSDQGAARTTPWYNMRAEYPTVYPDFEDARASVAKMQSLDQNENVLVCIAHDAVLLDYLPIFNKNPGQDINGWKGDCIKEKCHWGWMREIAVDGQPAHAPLVEGFWRDGKLWDYEAFKKTLNILS
ncbi:hypothetical protein PCG10_002394 [Penicillium crustosum]|uniref:Metallo-beta-lactamase domain-containing protein n=1 Tax=Penicillium crustosum TaxID=36656 RepID=A0A9P5GFC2_PENCR|nr:uncharacterized protein N7487_000932 [Penicillium crustosum]KAF7516228.1 hypothetical protein PCG10_002394 [Penicillium crustosum]KAJ5417382.1 hypothetical protein N7487_000932 [Penicillium crustosum]